MDLKTYIDEKHIQRDVLATNLNVTSGMIGQWLSGHRKITPKKCVEIEKLTNGIVKRQELRPDDFWEIWPELHVAIVSNAPAASTLVCE